MSNARADSAPKRTPRVTLTKERILVAGKTFVRNHGLAALTMARLAEEQGVGEMTLYWHFPSKQVLLEAIADQFLAEVDVDEVGEVGSTGDYENLLTEHPDIGAFLCSRGPVFASEHGFRLADQYLQTALEAGHDELSAAQSFAAAWMALAGYSALMGGSLGRGVKGLELAAWKVRMATDAPDPEQFPALALVLPHLLKMNPHEYLRSGIEGSSRMGTSAVRHH